MLDFLSALPWQHQVLVGEALVAMALALHFIFIGHNPSRRESGLWALWDAAALGLFFWGGAHASLPHIAYGLMVTWALSRNVRRAAGALPVTERKPAEVGFAVTSVAAFFATLQITLLLHG